MKYAKLANISNVLSIKKNSNAQGRIVLFYGQLKKLKDIVTETVFVEELFGIFSF